MSKIEIFGIVDDFVFFFEFFEVFVEVVFDFLDVWEEFFDDFDDFYFSGNGNWVFFEGCCVFVGFVKGYVCFVDDIS